MEKDKFQELFEAKALAEQELEKLRSRVTILFSDIKGSTAYFERKGDVEGLAMVQRHNNLLIPQIELHGGRVVKTLGDAIMACFNEPIGAVKAAAGMQRALESDRSGREDEEHIHIRIGLHTGFGLLKDNDVYGDVVNAASRVQHQARPGQILITDVLIDAAKAAGYQCASFGKAEMKGKDEPIDVYAMAWSESANEQLIEEVQARFEARIKETKRRFEDLEEEFESARDQWRAERRKLNAEIEQLEESAERARESARAQVADELQSEIRFQLEEATRSRELLQQEFDAAREKWERDRNILKAQIASMQGTVIEAMERSNNPTRMALAVREQVDARLADAKQEWQMEWEGDRRRLTAEIDRFKKGPAAAEEKKDAARRALLVKLGKLPPGSGGPAARSADQWQKEFEDAKIQWETQRDQLQLKVTQLENDLRQNQDDLRTEIFHEMRSQYEPKLAEANRERKRFEEELQALTEDVGKERERFEERMRQFEEMLPQAQSAVRNQVTAELQMEFERRLDEANRIRSRSERKLQDTIGELESETRRARKQIGSLEEQLKEAREAAFKAQRANRAGTTGLDN